MSVLVYHDLPFFAPPLEEAGIVVHRLPRRRKLDLRFLQAFRRWMLEASPDLIHAFQLLPAAWGVLVRRTLPRRRRPVYVAAERSALLGSEIDRMAQRLVYRGSDAVTANSACVAEEISARWHVPPGRVHYLPNGIDLVDWDARALRAAPLSREPGCLHLGLVGGLRPEKNHVGLFDALALVEPGLRRRLRVSLVGGETAGSGHAAFLRNEILRRGLAGTVRILAETPEIPALLRVLDAVVLPSHYEGFPNVLLEAMASGLPAIATAVGDVPNLLEDGVTGLLVPPGDTSALALAMARLDALGDDGRRTMGRAARACVEARYRIDDVAQAHLALYRSLLGGASDGR